MKSKQIKGSYSAQKHYKGKVAKDYNKMRNSSLKWRREQILINKIIAKLPEESVILDLPIGTGRLLPMYKKSHTIFGIDISRDMLDETRNNSLKFGINKKIKLKQGNAENIVLKDNTVDFVICLRLLNLVPLSVLKNIIKEFSRVSKNGLILHVRMYEQTTKLDLFSKMLLDLRTHINTLVHYIFKKIFSNKNDYHNFKEKQISQNGYFLHSFDDIYKTIKENKLYISNTYFVDRGINFDKSYYTPLLVLKCLKNIS